MFIDNEEAREWLLKNGIFLYRDGIERMSVIAQKHKNDKVIFIDNPNKFLDKLEQNIAVFTKNEPLLVEVVFSDFTRYDNREAEINSHKKLLRDLKKESINFLNIKHAVLCKGAQERIIVFDLDTGDKHSVSKELADGLETCEYNSSTVEQAYKDLGVNAWTKKYEHAIENWKKVKAVR